jgi:ATP adenylyltransferase
VDVDRLWAPWRLEYVTGGEPPVALPEPVAWLPDADHECFLCRAAAKYETGSSADRQLMVVTRGPSTIVVLNRYPYNNGHLLISPLRHVGDLKDLTDMEKVGCIDLLAKFTAVYREHLNANGFNIGLNLGRVAGAGLPGHLHWHLVPRWAGDNNFMPVLAGVRVIPQSLDALWEMLRGALP